MQIFFQDQNNKKIKTESGVWIPASFKSDRYAKWKERSKLAQMQEDDGDEENPRKSKLPFVQRRLENSSFEYHIPESLITNSITIESSYPFLESMLEWFKTELERL